MQKKYKNISKIHILSSRLKFIQSCLLKILSKTNENLHNSNQQQVKEKPHSFGHLCWYVRNLLNLQRANQDVYTCEWHVHFTYPTTSKDIIVKIVTFFIVTIISTRNITQNQQIEIGLLAVSSAIKKQILAPFH